MKTLAASLAWTALACASGDASRPADSEAFARVAMIGASVTEGFSEGRKLLDAAIRGPHDAIATFATGFLGVAPEALLEGQIESALRRKATLVIAMDSLFWFLHQAAPRGEGCDRPHEADRSEPEATAAARLARLEQGLARLARVDAPLVIGEIPDMHRAERFLRAEQIPSAETLRRANARIHAWARERKRVLVLPFGAWMERLRGGSMTLPPKLGGDAPERFAADVALRADRLHPSAVGEVLLGAWLAAAIEEWLDPERRAFRVDAEDVRARCARALSAR